MHLLDLIKGMYFSMNFDKKINILNKDQLKVVSRLISDGCYGLALMIWLVW